jgi:choline-sulfatase
VLDTLEDCGFGGNTRVLYTSDHGDNLGARGLWGKQVLYEEAAKVPMILAGPGVPAGVVRAMPASHVDVYPSVMQCVGPTPGDVRGQPGVSPFRPRARTRRARLPSITRPHPAQASS